MEHNVPFFKDARSVPASVVSAMPWSAAGNLLAFLLALSSLKFNIERTFYYGSIFHMIAAFYTCSYFSLLVRNLHCYC